MKKLSEYNLFFEELTSIRDIKDKSDSYIDSLFDRLLHVLPNKGKLYKYRSFSSKHFNDVLKSISKGFIWLPTVTMLNDKIDTTFLYKTKRTEKDIESYYLKNKYKIFRKRYI